MLLVLLGLVVVLLGLYNQSGDTHQCAPCPTVRCPTSTPCPPAPIIVQSAPTPPEATAAAGGFEVEEWRNSWPTSEDWKATWQTLWEAYVSTASEGAHANALIPLEMMGPSGMAVPYEVKTIPGQGRGVYALRRVRKGELVWFSGGRVITVTDEEHYTRMLEVHTTQRHFIADSRHSNADSRHFIER
jgi:hypothetical protein